MKTTRRPLIEPILNPHGLVAVTRANDTRIQRIERAPVKFNVEKPNPPKRAPDVVGKIVPPPPVFEVVPWGPSYAYSIGIAAGDPGSLGEIPEGDAVFAYYYVFNNSTGTPSIESHNVDVTELLLEEPTPVYWPSGTPQDFPDLVVAHAVKATGPDAYFRYRLGADIQGLGGRIEGAGAITATDNDFVSADHDADATVTVDLPFNTDRVMLVTFFADVNAFDGGVTVNYPTGLNFVAISFGFYYTSLLNSGTGSSLTWTKSASSGSNRNDGYLASAGIVVAKP